MIYLVKREDGEEWIVERNVVQDYSDLTQAGKRSMRDFNEFMGIETKPKFHHIVLPKGTIKKILGYDLKPNNEPIEFNIIT